MSVRIALDTSFIMFMVMRRIPMDRLYDLFDTKVEVYTGSCVIKELKKIASSSSSKAPYASIALKVIDAEKIEIERSNMRADDWLLMQPMIATVDIRLAKIARNHGIRVISVTKSNRLSVT
ncbi:MAG: hypothetical protein ACP5H8_02950 [Candidatus Micrarchaeia archaeon]